MGNSTSCACCSNKESAAPPEALAYVRDLQLGQAQHGFHPSHKSHEDNQEYGYQEADSSSSSSTWLDPGDRPYPVDLEDGTPGLPHGTHIHIADSLDAKVTSSVRSTRHRDYCLGDEEVVSRRASSAGASARFAGRSLFDAPASDRASRSCSPTPNTSIYKHFSDGGPEPINIASKMPKTRSSHESAAQMLEWNKSMHMYTWRWVRVCLDGWVMQIWNPRDDGIPGSRPIRWFDMRAVNRITVEDQINHETGKLMHQLKICMHTGDFKLNFSTHGEAKKWQADIRALAYDRDLGYAEDEEMHAPAVDLFHSRIDVLHEVWMGSIKRALDKKKGRDRGHEQAERDAAKSIFDIYDIDKDRNLSLPEFCILHREIFEMKRKYLIKRCEVYEKMINQRGRGASIMNNTEEPVNDGASSFRSEAQKLLAKYEYQLGPAAQKIVMDIRESADLKQNGLVDLTQLTQVMPMLFEEKDLLREATVHAYRDEVQLLYD